MTREEVVNYLEKNNEPYYPHTLDRVLDFINFESKEQLIQKNKQLEKENEELKDKLSTSYSYEEVGETFVKPHNLTKQENEELKKQIEKMKNCQNCNNLKDTGINCYCKLGLKMCKRNCDKWELAE